jgi:hypothetical protein
MLAGIMDDGHVSSQIQQRKLEAEVVAVWASVSRIPGPHDEREDSPSVSLHRSPPFLSLHPSESFEVRRLLVETASKTSTWTRIH